jgi:hypothetical protein
MTNATDDVAEGNRKTAATKKTTETWTEQMQHLHLPPAADAPPTDDTDEIMQTQQTQHPQEQSPAPSVGARKDMKDISPYVDYNATLSNFNNKKGTHQYAKDALLRNELNAIIAGATMSGDRLVHLGVIDNDKCECTQCDGARHTTFHMYWKCHRHYKKRDKCMSDLRAIIDKTRADTGQYAVDHIQQILENNAFLHTGICPQHTQTLKASTRNVDRDSSMQ